LAAGANEALVRKLAVLVNNDSNLLLMSLQLVGVAAAALSNGNVQQSATIAKDGTNYNYLLDDLDKCGSRSCRDNVPERYALLDQQLKKALAIFVKRKSVRVRRFLRSFKTMRQKSKSSLSSFGAMEIPGLQS